MQDARAIWLSYHDGEHYNSVRRTDDTGSGPPLPVALATAPGAGGPAEGTPQAHGGWDPRAEEAVAAGTGCYHDRDAVRRALADARGDPDQARAARGWSILDVVHGAALDA